VLPLGAIKSLHGDEGTFLRFCLDLPGDTFYIQDESFRHAMSSGDPLAWGMLNSALAWADSKHGMRFPKRAFGDPPGSSVRRRLSQYSKAWEYLSDFLSSEFSSDPGDMDVTEYIPDGSDDRTVFLGDDGVRVNRYMNRSWESTGKATGDVDYGLINDEVVAFLLSNAKELSGRFPEAFGWLDRAGPESYFACRVGGKPRAFKAGDHDENSIRERAGLPASEAVIMFTVNPKEREICLGNCMPSFVREHDQELSDSILSMVSGSIGASTSSVFMTFSPGLSRPFMSKLSRHRVVWESISSMGWPTVDVPVMDVPLKSGNGAALIRSNDEEEALVPGLARYRVTHGMEAEYPYIAADVRLRPADKARAMLQEYAKLVPEANDEASRLPPGKFMAAMRDPSRRKRAVATMKHLMAMGMSESEALDVMAGYDDLLKRAEYRRMLAESKNTKVASRVADMGPGLGINDWWSMGLQEDINRTQHTNGKPPEPSKKPKPYNRRKTTDAPSSRPLGGLLEKQHDKNAPAQKSVEQLLRESRV
jgi:hypothetical protein